MIKLIIALILIVTPTVTSISIIPPLYNEIYCLTKNVYYEARGEGRKGMIAVALVTINRTEDKRFPKSICGVVYQRKQFSWTAKPIYTEVNDKAWREAYEASLEAYMNRYILGNFRATHFHNIHVNPKWKLRKVTQIGNHIFYM